MTPELNFFFPGKSASCWFPSWSPASLTAPCASASIVEHMLTMVIHRRKKTVVNCRGRALFSVVFIVVVFCSRPKRTAPPAFLGVKFCKPLMNYLQKCRRSCRLQKLVAIIANCPHPAAGQSQFVAWSACPTRQSWNLKSVFNGPSMRCKSYSACRVPGLNNRCKWQRPLKGFW